MAANDVQTCLLDAGAIYCWGLRQVRAPRVWGIDNAVDIALGGSLGCALRRVAAEPYDEPNTVACWFGDAQGFVSPPERRLRDLDTAGWRGIAIFGGPLHGEQGCIVHLGPLRMGYVRCWGDGHYRVRSPAGYSYVDVVLGEKHACTLTTAGRVACWGEPPREDRPYPLGLPVQPVGDLHDAVQIAAGIAHTCALRRGGRVMCWGNNFSGELGDGTRRNERRAPVRVRGVRDAVHVACGRNHTCAARRNGEVWCWGANREGQLGDGTGRDSALPVRARWVEDAAQLAAGARQTCALRRKGAVICWGGGG